MTDLPFDELQLRGTVLPATTETLDCPPLTRLAVGGSAAVEAEKLAAGDWS